MPQDSLKSIVYRSFLTCDDPKGVAEFKTTTKSKKSTHHEKQKEKASYEELQKLSCFLEVSREAERLVNRPSKRIATELLRGALDLQESLIMLRKLQEGYKHREKSKTSADVAPRDCYDELREVIRESFARQNLLPRERICDVDGKSCDKKKMQGSNLIAKLMGLEEVPSKAASFKQMKEKTPYQRSHLLDVNASFLRGDVDVDGPPIVIMRPLRRDRGEELHHHHFHGGEHIKSRQMPRNMRGDFPPRVHLKPNDMKSKHGKGNEEKNSVKKTLDCQDRLSATKFQKKEVVARNIDQLPREKGERKEVKPQRSDKTQDLAKLTTVKQIRNLRENNVSKSPTRRKVAAPPDPIVVKKNPRKVESNRELSSALVKHIESDGNFAFGIETNVEETLVKNTEPEQNTEEVDKDPMSGAENSVNGETKDDDLNHIKDGICIQSVDSDEIKACQSTINTKSLLLSRVSFLNHVEDICDGIEDLKRYSRSCRGVVVVDSIYPMLERDLRWKEEATGAWNSGWRKGYTTEAADEVRHGVEEMVLSEIVYDAILEFCCRDFGL